MAKIMIADNASFMRACLKYILEQGGHEVVALAKDGKEAIDLYQTLKPDVVTLDILMEGTDGIAGLRGIRKVNPQAKVLMVTALGQEQILEECRREGAAGYLRKPFKPEQVMAEIDRLMKQ